MGGRGSAGGNAKSSAVSKATGGNSGSKMTTSTFTRTEKGISITNSDGTKDRIILEGRKRTTPVNGDAANKGRVIRTRKVTEDNRYGVDRYIDSTYTQVYKTSHGTYEVDFSKMEGYSGQTLAVTIRTPVAVRKRRK